MNCRYYQELHWPEPGISGFELRPNGKRKRRNQTGYSELDTYKANSYTKKKYVRRFNTEYVVAFHQVDIWIFQQRSNLLKQYCCKYTTLF